ncbi:MAG: hypothetical protein KAJ19_12745 [Gammaproteobacteria bacterium]|nr:hypothetical protein [Gammaproteobacteria bacterium]
MPLAKVALCDLCFQADVRRIADMRYWDVYDKPHYACWHHVVAVREAGLKVTGLLYTDVELAPITEGQIEMLLPKTTAALDALRAIYEAAVEYIALLQVAYMNLKAGEADPNWPTPSSQELGDVSRSWVDAVAALDRILESQDEKGD